MVCMYFALEISSCGGQIQVKLFISSRVLRLNGLSRILHLTNKMTAIGVLAPLGN